jgi:hypothetical protein
VLAGEEPAGPPEPGLDLVGDEQDPVLAGEAGQRPDELHRGRDEAALAQLQLDHDRRHRPGIHERGEQLVEVPPARHAALAAQRPAPRAAVAVRERDAVHLRRERPEALLVGHHLGRERQREIGTAMEAVLETDHRLPSGECPGHFHRVLDRLGAAVDEESPLLAGARGNPVEPLGELDVRLVGGDREADVGKAVELIPDRRDHAGMAVAGVHHADPAGEIDQSVAVRVGQYGPFGVHHRYRCHGGHSPGHCPSTAGEERTAGGSRNLGPELNDAGHGASATEWRKR